MTDSQSTTTTDHDEIRRWVEHNNGTPARVRDTGDSDDPGILRFDFPGGAGTESLEQISWDDWFEKFESQNLALLYQQQKSSGEGSTFFKLVQR